ncbi:MAG: hypothetical protein GY759_09120 [Chloroflexi bacterium]|nr:hypothetical protein [Chloroflexota bacterium]
MVTDTIDGEFDKIKPALEIASAKGPLTMKEIRGVFFTGASAGMRMMAQAANVGDLMDEDNRQQVDSLILELDLWLEEGEGDNDEC